MQNKQNKNNGFSHLKRNMQGFTLLEILIALFLFTILSVMMVNALHSVMNADEATERYAARLRDLQLGLLFISRDVEQMVDRPILGRTGHQEPAFVGSSNGFTFTHGGVADPTGQLLRSTLQRTHYGWSDKCLWRFTWRELDEAPDSKPAKKEILCRIREVRFQYLTKAGKFQADWQPKEGTPLDPLPSAISIVLTFENGEKITQLYVIPAQSSQTNKAAKS